MIHVLFDIDETLLSVKHGINRRSSAIMFHKVFGADTDEETIQNAGKTEALIIREVMAHLGTKIRKVPEEAYRVWGEAAGTELEKNPPIVLPGIKELLEELSKKDFVKLALLTGNSPWRSEAKLVPCHLDHFFRDKKSHKLVGVFGDITEKRSDLIDFYKNNFSNKDKFVIIDDSLIGAKMSVEKHTPSILVATGKISVMELKKYSGYVFENFGENRWKQVVEIIENI